MEGELWAAKLASKRSHLLQVSQLLLDRHLNSDDLEVDEDIRSDFACPYCYEEFDIASLCSHLEEEHCFDGRPTVCPVCSVKVGNDVVGHITVQHSHLFKTQRRRRFRRPSSSSQPTLSMLSKELSPAHLQALLGTRPPSNSSSNVNSSSNNNNNNNNNNSSSISNSDSFLLSSLVSGFPNSETDEGKPSSLIPDNLSNSMSFLDEKHKPRCVEEPTLSSEEREQRAKQAASRAKFVQHLVLSTLWPES